MEFVAASKYANEFDPFPGFHPSTFVLRHGVHIAVTVSLLLWAIVYVIIA
jgi:hypothetical protein